MVKYSEPSSACSYTVFNDFPKSETCAEREKQEQSDNSKALNIAHKNFRVMIFSRHGIDWPLTRLLKDSTLNLRCQDNLLTVNQNIMILQDSCPEKRKVAILHTKKYVVILHRAELNGHSSLSPCHSSILSSCSSGAGTLHGGTKWSRFIGRRRGNEARLRHMKHWKQEAPLRGMKRSLTASLLFCKAKKWSG